MHDVVYGVHMICTCVCTRFVSMNVCMCKHESVTWCVHDPKKPYTVCTN